MADVSPPISAFVATIEAINERSLWKTRCVRTARDPNRALYGLITTYSSHEALADQVRRKRIYFGAVGASRGKALDGKGHVLAT